MSDKKLPVPKNPINDIMKSGLPNLPDILRDAVPIDTPQPDYNNGIIGNWWGNKKLEQLVAATEHQADIEENRNRTLRARLVSMRQVITYSATIEDQFGEYRFKRDMRKEALKQAELTTRKMELENNRLEISLYKDQAEASSATSESKIAELDSKIREIQFNKMMKEMENE